MLHAFQKKSKKGIKTARLDMEKLKARLKQAAEIHDDQQAAKQDAENLSDEAKH